MALYAMALGPDVAVSLNYAPNNGRVSSLDVTNDTGGPVYAEAVLEDGRVFGGTFQVGTTSQSLPGRTVTLTFDAQEEPQFTGLAGIALRVPA